MNLLNLTPEACWSGRSLKLCEELILTMGAQHDSDMYPETRNIGLHSLAIELYSFIQVAIPLVAGFLD